MNSSTPERGPCVGKVPLAVFSVIALAFAALVAGGLWWVYHSESLSTMARPLAAGGMILGYVILLGCGVRVVNRCCK